MKLLDPLNHLHVETHSWNIWTIIVILPHPHPSKSMATPFRSVATPFASEKTQFTRALLTWRRFFLYGWHRTVECAHRGLRSAPWSSWPGIKTWKSWLLTRVIDMRVEGIVFNVLCAGIVSNAFHNFNRPRTKQCRKELYLMCSVQASYQMHVRILIAFEQKKCVLEI